MQTEELVFLLGVTVVMPVAVLWMIFSFQKARMKMKQIQDRDSLTVSELNSIIDESVAEATEPLRERIAEVEEQLRLVGPASEGQRLSGDLELDPESESNPAPVKTLGKTR